MPKSYNNLIELTAGFKYSSKNPLDDRLVVNTYDSLTELVNSNIAYEGMIVAVIKDSVKSNCGIYQYVNIENKLSWKKIATIDDVSSLSSDVIHNSDVLSLFGGYSKDYVKPSNFDDDESNNIDYNSDDNLEL